MVTTLALKVVKKMLNITNFFLAYEKMTFLQYLLIILKYLYHRCNTWNFPNHMMNFDEICVVFFVDKSTNFYSINLLMTIVKYSSNYNAIGTTHEKYLMWPKQRYYNTAFFLYLFIFSIYFFIYFVRCCCLVFEIQMMLVGQGRFHYIYLFFLL